MVDYNNLGVQNKHVAGKLVFTLFLIYIAIKRRATFFKLESLELRIMTLKILFWNLLVALPTVLK